MSFKKCVALALALSVLTISGCGKKEDTPETTLIESTYVSEAFDTENMFSDRDLDSSFDEGAKSVTLDNESVTVASAGTFIFSGSISDGQIIVDAGKEDKIQIVLNGVDITSAASAAIYIKQADKVFITLAQNSENRLTNTNGFTPDGETNVDGVIFSKDDLTLNGKGSLIVESAGHGIVSKDDLVITEGNYNITATAHAISGKDSIRIAGGDINLTSGKDGLHAENTEDTELGFIYQNGGSIKAQCDGDGMDASAKLQIDGGSFDIISGGGAAEAPAHIESFKPGNYGGYTEETDTPSTKGIKASGSLIITKGDFRLDSADDAIHSNTSVEITGGSFEIASGDDGFHADNALYISDGSINITKSYEGLEGLTIDILGGDIKVVASDDGLNAAGGNDQSGFGGPGGGGRPDQFGASSDSFIKIMGGKLYVNASGDGIDSNGALYVSGGETYVDGPTNSGNGALDYGSTAEISGGIFIAVGAAGMSTGFTSGSTQGAILMNCSGGAGVTVTLENSEKEEIFSYTPSKNYNSVVLSHPEIVKGEKYTLTVGSYSYDIEMDEIIYGSSGGMGGMGRPGMGGGRPGMGGMRP